MIARKSASWTAAAVAVAAALAVPHAQAQQPRVNWKMQSAFGSNLPHLGPPGHRFQKDIEDMTDGRFVVKFHEPGALVPTLECFDAASKGSVDACWTTPGFHAGKYPALAFFTTVPFGPQLGEFFAWKIFGNGNKLRAGDLRQARPDVVRCLRHRPRDFGLVPARDHLARPAEGPEDALLRPRRQGDAEARRVDAAARARRHLPGARARRDRRHGVLDAGHGHQAGLPPGGEVQLLPRLAPAGLGEPHPDEQEGLRGAAQVLQEDPARWPPATR